MLTIYTFNIKVLKWCFTFVIFLPKICNPSLNISKNLRQSLFKGQSTKCQTRAPQNSLGHLKQGESEKLSSQEETKEDRMAKCITVSWVGF